MIFIASENLKVLSIENVFFFSFHKEKKFFRLEMFIHFSL